MDVNTLVENALAIVRKEIKDFKPKMGLVLGSGLGGLLDNMHVITRVSYSDCPGFFKSTVEGHKGEFVFGTLENVAIVAMNGRVHGYEGVEANQILAPIRLMRALGCDALVITGATGSLKRELKPGSIVMLKDHINLSGLNVLVGPNQKNVGPRFQGMENAYDPNLMVLAEQAAVKLGIKIHEGVYVGVMGPSYETKAEIRMMGMLGGDVVGMSVVNDVIAAVHCGLKVLGLALVTNFAAGLSETLVNHQEVVEAAHEAAGQIESMLETFLREYADKAGAS